MTILHIFDLLLFIVFAVNIIYLFVFSLASHLNKKHTTHPVKSTKRVAILIPAYKEDAVIEECVEACLKQNYSRSLYDIVVISDRMDEHTNDTLGELPLKLIKVHFENSTKSKALNFAMAELEENYDIAVVLDADNTISPEFLNEINTAFQDERVRIIQAHRCAKNINTRLALLDAVSEEINNSIFRDGHSKLGLSAALIGSGMCFEYMLFKNTMSSINAIGGFDRALELTLLYNNIRIDYLAHTDVLDEKVQKYDDFSRQRRRWLSAQLHYMALWIKHIPKAMAKGKWDFCDKMFQQVSIPRILLLGFTMIFALTITFINPAWALKWWIALCVLIVALMIAIPGKLYRKELLVAIVELPYSFLLMALNVFKLKGANKKFIHTKHGINEKRG